MSAGQDFPISDYYKGRIVDAVTLSRAGSWWSAALVISDPRTEKRILNLYQWQLTDNGWKVRKNYSFKKQDDLRKFLIAIESLRPQCKWD